MVVNEPLAVALKSDVAAGGEGWGERPRYRYPAEGR